MHTLKARMPGAPARVQYPEECASLPLATYRLLTMFSGLAEILLFGITGILRHLLLVLV